MQLPLIRLDRVLHVGTMDPANLGSGGLSQEGHSLSVSLCPAAWTRIARLGGGTLHELVGDSGTFLDVKAVLADPNLLQEILDWATKEGLVEERTVWRADRFDDESEDWSVSFHPTLEEAIEETGADEESPDSIPGMGGRPGVAQVGLTVGTPGLESLTGLRSRPDEDATDGAIMAWAISVASQALDGGMDGLWWRDRYDPAVLSAPKGCIFPDRVASWTARPIARAGSDSEELRRMPATETVEASPRSPGP